MTNSYSEDILVEQPAIALFSAMGWEAANCYNETYGLDPHPGPLPEGEGERVILGRENRGEVLLISRLRPALEKLNPGVPTEAIRLAIEELTRDRSAMSLVAANKEVYKLLKEGFLGQVQSCEGEAEDFTIRFIDWNEAKNNDFFLASQFWVTGDMYTRRTDLLGFVNGIPLVFIELKAAHKDLKNAYDDNLKDYKDTIPQLFWYNSFIILSNGRQSRVGSITSGWEHFAEWKKINDEGEKGRVSLETVLRGTCDRERLLDIVENFILYSDAKGGTRKLVAMYHQYLGVNQSIRAVNGIKDNKGRLGVFWHTQGSGKSYSMVFFSQKVLRKVRGNWTFVIVTDRIDLDDQIYKNFASTGAVIGKKARAEGGEGLKQLLSEDHRYVFTLIQKFRTEKGEQYPKLSDRSDIIVITDEAHRSQYDTFALNMRNALPNAAFIGFTGTPLISGEERTREVFGEYVSIYNFRQAIEDNSTVPLYYENRIPGLELENKNLNEEMAAILEEAELDPSQEERLKREFAQEYQLITRDDRLDKIAADIVEHFMGRGFAGKAMVVSIDKATAVRMYEKFQVYWKRYLDRLRAQPYQEPEKIGFMKETDMAVVVSQSQNEVSEFRKLGLDIEKHRRRMNREQLDVKFKDEKDPLRIVFVCAMWMTGFDAPACSTIYLDKPMKNHTLMQTIARANRVFPGKNNGLIVDYARVFKNLEKALAIYGSGAGGNIQEGDHPVELKEKLVEGLAKSLAEAKGFCTERGIRLEVIHKAGTHGFERLAYIDEAVEILLGDPEDKDLFRSHVSDVNRLYKAILPDVRANEFAADVTLLTLLLEAMRRDTGDGGGNEDALDEVCRKVDELLDRSIVAEGYKIAVPINTTDHLIDLGKINFDKLAEKIDKARKRTEAERLRNLLEGKVLAMVLLNRTRIDMLERLKKLIEEYNMGAHNADEFLKRLISFAKDLAEEEQRHIREQLTEEELAIFDLLTKPDVKLSQKEEKQVKKAARELLKTLKQEKLSLDWKKRLQTRAQVKIAIRDILDKELPEVYNRALFDAKGELVYQHIYDNYSGEGKSVYV